MTNLSTTPREYIAKDLCPPGCQNYLDLLQKDVIVPEKLILKEGAQVMLVKVKEIFFFFGRGYWQLLNVLCQFSSSCDCNFLFMVKYKNLDFDLGLVNGSRGVVETFEVCPVEECRINVISPVNSRENTIELPVVRFSNGMRIVVCISIILKNF